MSFAVKFRTEGSRIRFADFRSKAHRGRLDIILFAAPTFVKSCRFSYGKEKWNESSWCWCNPNLTFEGCWQWLFFGCGKTSDAKLYEIFFPALHHQIIKISSSYNPSVRHKNQTFMLPHLATCLQECGVCWGYWLYASLRETAKRR